MTLDQKLLQKGFAGRILLKEPLAPYVAYRIGGPADFLLFPAHEQDVELAAHWAQENDLPWTVIGSGSNLLIRDGGIRGAVLLLGRAQASSIQKLSEDEKCVRLLLPASCLKASLIDYSLDHELSGAEFSAGIPGTMGGAVYMNAGTKWGSYSEILESVRFYQVDKGFYEKPAFELGLTYRGHAEGLFSGGALVISVVVVLRKGSTRAQIQARVDEILKYRGEKQPLEFPNCGSVFRNPPDSRRGAGRLIEACGLKGFTIGKAQVSLKHANFICNLGGATSDNVESLIAHIQKTVNQEFGIHLEPEVVVLGDQL